MKLPLIIGGLIVAILGFAGLSGKLSFKHDKEVAKIGDFSASVQKEQGVPQWLGIAGVVIGGVMVLGGALQKN